MGGTETQAPRPTLFGIGQPAPGPTWDERLNRVTRNVGAAVVIAVVAAGICVAVVLCLAWLAERTLA